MLPRLMGAGLLAGSLAAALLSLLQAAWVWPLIRAAERFEIAAPAADRAHDHAHDHVGALAELLPSAASTVLMNVLLGIACALLVAAVLTLRSRAGWRDGLLVGLAGFAAFTVAPSLGLPPELPGAAAADLAARQLWWLVAAGGTAAGLALLLLGRRIVTAVVGIALILLPYALGAPAPVGTDAAPPELTHAFIRAVLSTSLVFWACLGTLTGLLLARSRVAEPAAAPAR